MKMTQGFIASLIVGLMLIHLTQGSAVAQKKSRSLKVCLSTNGQLIAASKCGKNAKALTETNILGLLGSVGPQGPAGPVGPTGAMGPRGPSDIFTSEGPVIIDFGQSQTTIVSASIPDGLAPGRYLVVAKARLNGSIGAGGVDPQTVTCGLFTLPSLAGLDFSWSNMGDDVAGRVLLATVSLQAPLEVSDSSGNTGVAMRCQANQPASGNSVRASEIKLGLIQAENVNNL